MFNRESILKTLNSENYYIDNHSLDLFFQDWKIESIYEDEDGLEFYDDLALEKIKKGISLKAQGYSDEQIITKLSRMEAKVEKNDEQVQPIQPLIVSDVLENKQENSTEVAVADDVKQDAVQQQGKSFTLDVSSQTLQMLAEAVAKKISDDITNSDMVNKLVEAGGYKRDNEILAKQVLNLLNEYNLKAKLIKRGYKYIVYIKSSECISDLIKRFKAINSLFYFEDIRIYRDHKNMVNRLNNCEIANQEKSFKSGQIQINNIKYLKEKDIFSLLDEKTQIVANSRIKYPEVSMNELAEIISLEEGYKIGKSGVNHHFIKISNLVKKYQESRSKSES